MNSEQKIPPSDDAWIEQVLRENQSHYVNDDGFSRVVTGAIARRKRRRASIFTFAILLGGFIAVWFAGPGLMELFARAEEDVFHASSLSGRSSAYVMICACVLFSGIATWWALVRKRNF